MIIAALLLLSSLAQASVIDMGPPQDSLGHWEVDLYDASGNQRGTSGNPFYSNDACTQSGTWNLNNISGTISLPTGASTSALQTTGNSSLSSIDTKTPALVSGRVPVDGSGVTQPISAASLPLPSGASTSALQTTGNSSLSSIDTKTPALGQANMAGSSPVVIASNQSAIPVTGTFWQATQPVSGSLGRTWNLLYSTDSVTDRLQDGSGNAITSSTSGTNQLLHIQTPDTTTASTALGALNAAISITTAGISSVGFELAAGTLSATLSAQCQINTTWVQCPFYNPTTFQTQTTLTVTNPNSAQVLGIVPIGGTKSIQVIVTSYTSGTANAVLRGSTISSAGVSIAVSPSGSVSSAFGTVTNTFPATTGNTATLILSANSSRKYAYIANSTGTAVNIQFNSGTGLSTTTGLQIPAKSFYELKGDNLYTGAIYAFSASAITLSVTEGTP